jgi:excisionase family DNA binding protein
MDGPLLTARHVAELLGVAPATVLRWTRQGDLPALTLPSGQVRYRPDELDVWMGERATPGRGVLTPPEGRRPMASIVGVLTPSEDED